ncbi:MAG: AAA family ATPase [Acidimicrobiales bacterium]
MRPRRLELEGFSTFRDRVCLDFDGLDLVAFTGATGAGKSTLIDAITFALYGSVARYDNKGLVAPVIHQLVNQARVRLDFESGGKTYIATRVVKRRNSKTGGADSAATSDARLELVISGTGSSDSGSSDAVELETTVLAGDVKELNAAIEDLLGLDFRQFTRTVVLPQGDFAAFLRDEPANRDKLLQRLLDLGIYERMGQLARSEAKRAGHQAEILNDQIQRNPALPDADFEALTAKTAALAAARTVAEQKVGVLVELDGRLDPMRVEVRAIDDGIARLELVELPDSLPGLDRDLQQAVEKRSDCEEALVLARKVRDDAFATFDGMADKGELIRALSLVEQLAESREDLERLHASASETAELAARATAEQSAVDEAVALAEAAARAARLSADAAGWTAVLAVGEPCPVCHRDVETVPDHDAASELEQAEANLKQLQLESKQLAKQVSKMLGIEAASVKEIDRHGERIDLLELQLSTKNGPSDPALIATEIEKVESAEVEYRTAAAASGELESRLSTAADEESWIRRTLESMQQQLSTLRDSVADLEPPPLVHQSLVDDYDTMHRWAKDHTAALTERRAELAAEGKKIAAERGELVGELAALSQSVDIDCEVTELTATLTEALAEAKAAVTAAEQRRAEHSETLAQVEELNSERVLNDAMGRHLRAGGFGSWLLSEALDNIVAKATIWLLQLSNNQYSLVAGEKNFVIVDHNNADESRDVRTLSGGETFLASLALALALSDSIAELAPVDSPRLESMFLDEGFGTLDSGTLDLVAGAIEELASTGRMIGIVTHVNDLAERMPARFEVTKGPLSSSVELVEV